jgi:hypothetical protein
VYISLEVLPVVPIKIVSVFLYFSFKNFKYSLRLGYFDKSILNLLYPMRTDQRPAFHPIIGATSVIKLSLFACD